MAQARAQPDDAAASVVACTDVKQASGAILVTKTAKNRNLGGGPASARRGDVHGQWLSKVTDGNGRACFDELTFPTAYTVTETAVPAGISIDTTSKSVKSTSPNSCSSGTPDGVCFTDQPLTDDVLVKATSEVLPGAPSSAITCVCYCSSNIGNTPQGPTDSAQVTKPATYACTIVVDP